MKVIDWIEYDDPKYEDVNYEEYKEAYPIIVEEVRKNGYHFNGSYHQNGEYSCPLLDIGKKVCMSQRTWGGVIAEAFPEEFDDPNDRMNYIVWYLGPIKEENGKYYYDSEKCKYPKDEN